MERIRVTKYELWRALALCPDVEILDSGTTRTIKTDDLKELEKLLNDSMSKEYYAVIEY